ncbi:MAG TPA: phenylalanine--tRNA ligase subunit alpha [Candidatus Marinimicrobia bacterium]|jgi:phenylalanyl-tRNA synthetase alpha chain|nr:phenylalanine--tRNA ligase subunit alpha [Candidatus Neomarinimicrobiota bacterium]
MQETIEAVWKAFQADLDSFPTDRREVDSLKSKYFGRNGALAKLFSQMGKIAPEERPGAGKLINDLKKELTEIFDAKSAELFYNAESTTENVDYTLPGETQRIGTIHPVTKTLKEIKDIFKSIGFMVAYGPEIDDDYHNFTALNFPQHHPARDMQDTFFIQENVVLRTHTSNVQIHLMENTNPPLRYIVPGRVYRNEAISFKSYCLFHQVEGLVVDKYISFADLKGTLEYFVKRIFGNDVRMRFRPSFFPFTEPSAEVDIWDDKRQQWLEILGCGMVDPAVFENVGYDPNIWHGYAFGLGIERIAMLKYGITDIRLFFQGDKRFLEQF